VTAWCRLKPNNNCLADIVFDAGGEATKLLKRVSQMRRIHFVLALAGVAASDIEFISAAGATAQARRLTPALDADALVSSANNNEIPKSPGGIASPVVLTRAALSLIPHKTTIVDCGSFVSPSTDHIKAGRQPSRLDGAAHVDALNSAEIKLLYQAGLDLAEKLSAEEIVVLAECVPGGTTTAQATFMALGIDAEHLLSSSLVENNHAQKIALAALAVANAAARRNLNGSNNHSSSVENRIAHFKAAPLDAIAAVGDPMQAFAVALVSARAACGAITVLAGGSQMLAVYALAAQVASNQNGKLSDTLVATTKWVARDTTADTAALAQLLGAPYVASGLSLSKSQHSGLRAYEEGHVKEGVGAGAALLLASVMAMIDEQTLLTTIDSFYSVLT